jgi:tRNA(Met) cytidine acetyltransferase
MLEEFTKIKEKLREVTRGDYREFLRNFKHSIKVASLLRQRRLIVLCGSDGVKLSGLAVELVIRYLKTVARGNSGRRSYRVLYFYHDEVSEAVERVRMFRKVLKHYAKKSGKVRVSLETAVYEQSSKYLGTTVQVLVLDLMDDLRPNDIGRLLGIVEGGGFIVMLTPPHDTWPRAKTFFKQILAVPNHPEPRHIFISWFLRNLYNHNGVIIYDADGCRLLKGSQEPEVGEELRRSRPQLKIPSRRVFPKELYELALTQDQVEVIKAIEDNLVEKFKDYKHQVVVVIADRGRGKSSAVGLGIVGLIEELLKFKNRVRVAVTANELNAVQSLMDLACKALDTLKRNYRVVKRGGLVVEIKGDRFSIEYWPPLDVLRLGVDVVVVDEAAGIPVPLLHRVWRGFRRTVFSTTIHGYEGAGRGFSVRFLKRVREDRKTKLVIVEMEEPIRYSVDDPIESLQFDALLLDAEPKDLTEEDFEAIRRGEYDYVKLEPEELFAPGNEDLLRQLFGIYVLAHYRNEPDDLGMIADAPHHSVRTAILRSGKVVGAVQLAEEGGLSDDYVDELLKGGKIPGNIIPDRLLKHLRRRVFGYGVGWRIVRIAVHIDAQGMGVGSELLRRVVEEAGSRGYDWVGAGFGVTYELLKFWLKNGFRVLHVSPERNPVSGEYTALVVYPISKTWTEAVEEATEDFIVRFVESLPSVYRDFETDAAYLMLSSVQRKLRYSERLGLGPTQVERLHLYLNGVFTLEVVFDAALLAVKKLVYEGRMACLDQKSGQLLIARLLQGRDWDSVAEEVGMSKVAAANAVREALGRVLKYLSEGCQG